MAEPTVDDLFRIGLDQLPEKSKAENYQDVLQLYTAMRNLMLQMAIQTGLIPPGKGLRTTALAAFTAGFSKRRYYTPASEVIAYGQMMNYWLDGATVRARLADASDATRMCHAVCNTEGGVGIGGNVEGVLPSTHIVSVTGLTPGDLYYLSPTAGAIQNGPPAGTGNLIQAIGFAIQPNGLFFHPSYQTQVAP